MVFSSLLSGQDFEPSAEVVYGPLASQNPGDRDNLGTLQVFLDDSDLLTIDMKVVERIHHIPLDSLVLTELDFNWFHSNSSSGYARYFKRAVYKCLDIYTKKSPLCQKLLFRFLTLINF